jgi:peptide-methionine (S)-S-oxide reductase
MAYAWRAVQEEAAFAPRDGAGALTLNGAMYLLGGWNPDPAQARTFPRVCNSEVWRSVSGSEWELVCKEAPWEGRHCAGYVVHDGRMFIVGGDVNQGHYQTDVWSSADGVEWECVCSEVPWCTAERPRTMHQTVALNGYIYIMGGQSMPETVSTYHSHSFELPSGEQVFHADVWRSSDGRHWEQIADNLPWAPRCMIGGSAVLHGRMWLLGGGTYDTPQSPSRVFHNDVWSSADGEHWIQHTGCAPWEARSYHDVCSFDGKLWVMEGHSPAHWIDDDGSVMAGNRKDVWWSGNGADWFEVPKTPWLPRHASSVFVHDNGLWMVAGNSMTSDVWKLEAVAADAADAGAAYSSSNDSSSARTVETATFAANCFWGTEAIFGRMPGVITTAAGFSNGREDSVEPSYEEVSTGETHHAEIVRLTFDPQLISYAELLERFWSCHDTTITTWHRQSGTTSTCPEGNPQIWQYRSAIFTHSSEQAQLAEAAVAEHQKAVPSSLTYTEPAQTFHAAEDYHQKYLLQQQPAVFIASGLESRAFELMHSRLACKLNGFVGASASAAEREQLLEEVLVLSGPTSTEAFGMGQPDADLLRELLSGFQLEESGTLKPQPPAQAKL